MQAKLLPARHFLGRAGNCFLAAKFVEGSFAGRFHQLRARQLLGGIRFTKL